MSAHQSNASTDADDQPRPSALKPAAKYASELAARRANSPEKKSAYTVVGFASLAVVLRPDAHAYPRSQTRLLILMTNRQNRPYQDDRPTRRDLMEAIILMFSGARRYRMWTQLLCVQPY
jgi:hypothetical protein